MEPQHEQVLKSLLQKSPQEFTKWVGTLPDEELAYVEFLLEKAEVALDDLLFEEYGLAEAQKVLDKISMYNK